MGSLVEDNMGYHGKPLSDQTDVAINHLQSLIHNKSLKLTVNQINDDEQIASTVDY